MLFFFLFSGLLCFLGGSFAAYLAEDVESTAVHITVLIGAGVFILSGILLIIGGFYFSSRQKRMEQLKAQFPQAPWRWRPEWENGRIVSSNLTLVLVLFGFAVFWSLVTAPLLFLLPEEIRSGNSAAAFGYVLPLSGLGLWVVAIYNFIRWKKYGNSVLQLPDERGKVGGTLRATAHLPSNLVPEGSVRITLMSVERINEQVGNKRSTQEVTLWQVEQSRDASSSSLRVGLPIEFAVPAECQPTSADSSNNPEFAWKLMIEVPTAGVDFSAQFSVPVF